MIKSALSQSMCRCAVTVAAMVSGLMFSGLSSAQTLQAHSYHGLTVQPDSTTVFNIPLGQNWELESQFKLPSVGGPEGLKMGLGGGYGWSITPSSRVAILAGIGLTERNPSPVIAGRLAGWRDPLQTVGGLSSYNKDLRVNLHWDWQVSSAVAFTSGVGLSFGVGDGQVPPGNLNLPFGSSTGYVGLKFRF
jgi:hypothetical protein